MSYITTNKNLLSGAIYYVLLELSIRHGKTKWIHFLCYYQTQKQDQDFQTSQKKKIIVSEPRYRTYFTKDYMHRKTAELSQNVMQEATNSSDLIAPPAKTSKHNARPIQTLFELERIFPRNRIWNISNMERKSFMTSNNRRLSVWAHQIHSIFPGFTNAMNSPASCLACLPASLCT